MHYRYWNGIYNLTKKNVPKFVLLARLWSVRADAIPEQRNIFSSIQPCEPHRGKIKMKEAPVALFPVMPQKNNAPRVSEGTVETAIGKDEAAVPLQVISKEAAVLLQVVLFVILIAMWPAPKREAVFPWLGRRHSDSARVACPVANLGHLSKVTSEIHHQRRGSEACLLAKCWLPSQFTFQVEMKRLYPASLHKLI